MLTQAQFLFVNQSFQPTPDMPIGDIFRVRHLSYSRFKFVTIRYWALFVANHMSLSIPVLFCRRHACGKLRYRSSLVRFNA